MAWQTIFQLITATAVLLPRSSAINCEDRAMCIRVTCRYEIEWENCPKTCLHALPSNHPCLSTTTTPQTHDMVADKMQVQGSNQDVITSSTTTTAIPSTFATKTVAGTTNKAQPHNALSASPSANKNMKAESTSTATKSISESKVTESPAVEAGATTSTSMPQTAIVEREGKNATVVVITSAGLEWQRVAKTVNWAHKHLALLASFLLFCFFFTILIYSISRGAGMEATVKS